MMNNEGAFPRLLELIQMQRKNGVEGDGPETGLHRMLMELLYEMSRIQRVKIQDLGGFSLYPSFPLRRKKKTRDLIRENGQN